MNGREENPRDDVMPLGVSYYKGLWQFSMSLFCMLLKGIISFRSRHHCTPIHLEERTCHSQVVQNAMHPHCFQAEVKVHP